MQRSSASIGTLASALAKAQGELVNPEKSLVATLSPEGRGGTEKTFRYAPLSSGLDIVRKILGQHEIAIVQTTSIDQATGIINLTTVLAHASGEWIASEWPVCAISETSTPHRMGAALTYARRYALFTLVGIAGEDDLDAPDPATPTTQTSRPEKPHGKGVGNGRLNGGGDTQPPPVRRDETFGSNNTALILGPDELAKLRDRLLVELSALGTSDDAAMWALGVLAEKNKLTAADARTIENSFRAKLEALGAPGAYTAENAEVALHRRTPSREREAKPKTQRPSRTVDKSVLAMPEPRRVRDREHVKIVARHPCLICSRQPADAHHLRFAQSRALSRKVSDEFTVPLCRGHHREVHRCGDEVAWWRRAGIDPTVPARSLWLETHPQQIGQERPILNERRQLESHLQRPLYP
jgi:hypothetical protein